MIPIKIEATNPSNIGGFKNTPNCSPSQPRIHDKPEKGSYKDWIKDKLTENKHIFLEDMNLTEEEVISSCMSEILQDEKYPYISYWLDNEVDNAAVLESNEKELYSFIKGILLPLADKEYAERSITEISVKDICKSGKNELDKLEYSLSKQYGKGVVEN